MPKRWVTWDEPFREHGNQICFVTESTAISAMKATAAEKQYVYLNDEQALADFMTVHYAWFCDPPIGRVRNNEDACGS